MKETDTLKKLNETRFHLAFIKSKLEELEALTVQKSFIHNKIKEIRKLL